MIIIFRGKPLYFIEETEGFSISKDSIHLSLVIVYSCDALGISNYPDIGVPPIVVAHCSDDQRVAADRHVIAKVVALLPFRGSELLPACSVNK